MKTMRLALFAAALVLLPGGAGAQSSQSVVAPITAPLTTRTMTDAISDVVVTRLGAYVAALVEVDALVRLWQPRIAGAASRRQAADLRARADAELEAAIQRTRGISVAEYRRIGQAAASDPALRSRIHRMFRERTGN